MLKVNRFIKYLYFITGALLLVVVGHFYAQNQDVIRVDYKVYEYVGLYFNPNKRSDLHEYAVICGLLFIYSISFLVLQMPCCGKARVRLAREFLKIKINLVVYSLISIAFLFLSILNFNGHGGVKVRFFVQLLLFVSFLVFPYRNYWNKLLLKIFTRLRIVDRYIYYFVLLLVSIVQFVYVYYEPIAGKIKLINEFYEIPEKTILPNGSVVDNTSYINEHFGGGTWNKWDILNPVFNNYYKINLDDNGLYQLVDEYPEKYFVDSLSSRIYINSYDYLAQDTLGINRRIYALRKHRDGLDKKYYTLDEKAFLKSNLYELRHQIYERNMYHHQAFMLMPMLQYEKGVELGKINAQYGYGNIVIFSGLLKALGGISLDRWLRVLYSTYYVYYFMYLIVLYGITRSLRFTAVMAGICIYLINITDSAVSTRFLYLPPGHFPWRNFFDIIIVYLLYRIRVAKYKKMLAISVVILADLSVYVNPQIGAMIMASSVASLVYYYLKESKMDYLVATIAIIGVLVGGYIYVVTQYPGDLSKYYLDGVIGFAVDKWTYVIIAIIVILSYAALVSLNARNNIVHLVFLVLYSQMLLMYYVWQYQDHALLVRSFVYLLTVGMLVYYIYRELNIDEGRAGSIKSIILIVTTLLVVKSSLKLHKTNADYEKLFVDHKVYEWKMKRANIVTTMNPVYFESSVRLIDKYSPDEAGIYIISQYDNLLPFLSGKYSNMPFLDLKWYFITEKEYRYALDILKKDEPEYLYVDTGIIRNMNDDIVDDGVRYIGAYRQESLWRVKRHKLLRDLFLSIKDKYFLVEESPLISVYKIRG